MGSEKNNWADSLLNS